VNQDELRRRRENRRSNRSSTMVGGLFALQYALQEMMQELVGIVRQEQKCLQALDRIQQLKTRSGRVGVGGNREYNGGWHTGLIYTHR